MPRMARKVLQAHKNTRNLRGKMRRAPVAQVDRAADSNRDLGAPVQRQIARVHETASPINAILAEVRTMFGTLAARLDAIETELRDAADAEQ